jgi:hypothetical protein
MAKISKSPFRSVGKILIVSSILGVVLLAAFSTCGSLIALDLLPLGDVQFPVPVDCTNVSDAPPAAVLDFMEKRRTLEGLSLVRVITCKTHQSSAAVEEGIDNDHRWLPSYVPGPYQYRRYVAVPAVLETLNGTLVVVELCKKSRRRYYRQIVGNCEKYSIWR